MSLIPFFFFNLILLGLCVFFQYRSKHYNINIRISSNAEMFRFFTTDLFTDINKIRYGKGTGATPYLLPQLAEVFPDPCIELVDFYPDDYDVYIFDKTSSWSRVFKNTKKPSSANTEDKVFYVSDDEDYKQRTKQDAFVQFFSGVRDIFYMDPCVLHSFNKRLFFSFEEFVKVFKTFTAT